jgi:DUF4097 and DUF4098 domain-containing protein YvlB
MRRKWWIVGILGLVEVLVCVGILLTLWVGRSSFEGIRLFYVADTHVEETVEETFTVDGPAILDLEADFGDVTVTGSDGGDVEVIARLSLWGSDEQDARQQADVRMTQAGNRVIVRVDRPEYIYAFGVNKGSRVDFEIRVPPGISLQLVTSSGDLEVSDVVGTVEIETSFGSVQIEDVSGTVTAQSDSGGITLSGLSDGGDVEVETNFGELILQNITADSLVARSDSGEIRMDGGELVGVLELRTNFGSVTVQDVVAERLTASSESGEIRAEEIVLDGPLDLESSFGSVTAAGVDASSYRLKSSSGSLTLDGCGGSLDLQTEFGDIEVQNAADAALILKTSSGKVFFSGSLRAEGEHRAESEFGDVHLIIPADTAFDLDAQTDFGSVETDFAVTMVEFEKKHIVGSVNGGGPSLRMTTGSGDVTLESMTGEDD